MKGRFRSDWLLLTIKKNCCKVPAAKRTKSFQHLRTTSFKKIKDIIFLINNFFRLLLCNSRNHANITQQKSKLSQSLPPNTRSSYHSPFVAEPTWQNSRIEREPRKIVFMLCKTETLHLGSTRHYERKLILRQYTNLQKHIFDSG